MRGAKQSRERQVKRNRNKKNAVEWPEMDFLEFSKKISETLI